MAIKDNLICFWELEEASGTRADSHGTMTLSDGNTVTSNTGKVGTAAEFTKTNSEVLYHADHADLEPGDADFTFAAWAYLTTGRGNYPNLFGKQGSDFPYSYWCYNLTSEGLFYFRLSNDGTAIATVAASNFGAVSLDTWYFVVCQYDAGANQMSISVNNGTPNTASQTGGAVSNDGAFWLGSIAWGDPEAYWNGRIDQVGFWKRKITTDEITWLYNSGNGRSYADMAETTPLTVNLTSNLNG